MRSARRRLLCLLASALLGTACSGSEEPEAAPKPVLSVFESASSSAGRDEPAVVRAEGRSGETPVVEKLDFEPPMPESRGRFRAVARVSGDWTSIQYDWTLNGTKFGPNAADVVLPKLTTGDRIAVRVTPYQNDEAGEAVAMEMLVRNQRPILSGLSIERVDADEDSDSASHGERWRAAARANDPDDDRVEFEYRWLVNGKTSDVTEEFFPTAGLAKGDRVSVRVRAFDGQAWSAPSTSGEIEIGSSPPKIVSVPPRPDATGFFRYDVRVEDSSSARPLRFGLRTSPRGMKIDEDSGLVTWRPDADQAGRHEVVLVVENAEGAETTQSFSIALVATKDEPAPGPAAAQ